MTSHAALGALLAELEAEFRMTANQTGETHLEARVREALRQVPREQFVPESLHRLALDNAPLPIGYGQTISQPFVVALMTQLLHPAPDMVVLEVGTGSGYQAAVLSRLVGTVHTTEVVPELAAEAAERLQRLGYGNVVVHATDGALGLPEFAPFDAIIATAAPLRIPEELISQLATGGRMVVPVGPSAWGQQLLLVEKDAQGHAQSREVLPVAFVPMTGAGARAVR